MSNKYIPFKERNDLSTRKQQSESQLLQYPDLVPVVIEMHKRSTIKTQLDKTKYLVQKQYNYSKLQTQIREKLKLSEKEAIFFYVNGDRVENQMKLMQEVYEANKDEDGFLYITITNLETYGQ